MSSETFIVQHHREIDVATVVIETVQHLLQVAHSRPRITNPPEAVLFGGSYAVRGVVDGDVDVDFLYPGEPDEHEVGSIQFLAAALFRARNMDLHVRTHLGRNGVAITFDRYGFSVVDREHFNVPTIILALTERHSNSPFVAINQEAAQFWRLGM